jgi:hypothetical protein
VAISILFIVYVDRLEIVQFFRLQAGEGEGFVLVSEFGLQEGVVGVRGCFSLL